MAFRRKRRHSDTDPFTDLLFNALLGFTFMFLIAVFFLNPPTQTGEIPAKAEYIVTATWESGRPDDVDLWVQGPGGDTVWYLHPEAGLMNLDRDDRGLVNPRGHRALLDRFAGVDGAKLAAAWTGWRRAEDALAEARLAVETAKADQDLLLAHLAELPALELRIEITDVDRRLPPRVLTIGFLVVFFHQYQWGITVELRGGSARSLSNDWLDALSSDIS